MTKFAKDSNNQLCKDSSGKLNVNIPVEHQPLQNGLLFWAVDRPENMTIVNGQISELYDIRKNGLKLTQSNVSLRPYFYNDSIYNGFNFYLSLSGLAWKSGFIVLSMISTSANDGVSSGISTASSSYTGVGFFASNKLGAAKGSAGAVVGLSSVVNGVVKNYTYGTSVIGNWYVINSINDSLGASDLYLKGRDAYYVKEFGVYNRILTEKEGLYNDSVMKLKYSIY